MLYLLLFHCNNGCTNAAQYYIIGTLHVLFPLFIPVTVHRDQEELQVIKYSYSFYSAVFSRIHLRAESFKHPHGLLSFLSSTEFSKWDDVGLL